MGRYSTVQAFADNNPNMRKVTYDQAAGGAVAAADTTSTKSSGAAAVVRPEKVVNPYGSTAGAGSGEFHVYRNARSREMMRIQQLDEEDKDRKADDEFWRKVMTEQEIELKKTEQRRKKRQREKEAKLKKKVMRLNGLTKEKEESRNEGANGNFDDEFEYTPTGTSQEESSKVTTITSCPSSTNPAIVPKNDEVEQN